MNSVGKSLDFFEEDVHTKVLLVVSLDDSSNRAQQRKVKKLIKLFLQYSAHVIDGALSDESNFSSLNSLLHLSGVNEGSASCPPILHGIYIPLEQLDRFNSGLFEISAKRSITLPLYGRPLEGIWRILPSIDFKTVGGKQIVMKLIDDVSKLATACGGSVAGEYGEGRLQAYSSHGQLDQDVRELYASLRAIFDPKHILNPGVKEPTELPKLIKTIRSEYAPGYSDGLAR